MAEQQRKRTLETVQTEIQRLVSTRIESVRELPNGCSTVSRRRRMACGSASSLVCTASSTWDRRRGHRLTRFEGVADQVTLIQRLAELTPALWPSREAIPAAPNVAIGRP
jgi:hypothetical protein